MKNLATCKPSEFVAQTAKIKDAVADWLDATEILKIRAIKPQYITAPLTASEEERAEVIKTNARLEQEQASKNLSLMLDNMLAKYPEKTLEVLALCCFVEPEKVDDHPIDEYLNCILEMLQNKAVLNFFTLLAQLDQRAILTASEA